MKSKPTNLFLTVLIVLVAFAGCDRTQKVVIDEMPIDSSMPEMEAIPVKLVYLIVEY